MVITDTLVEQCQCLSWIKRIWFNIQHPVIAFACRAVIASWAKAKEADNGND